MSVPNQTKGSIETPYGIIFTNGHRALVPTEDYKYSVHEFSEGTREEAGKSTPVMTKPIQDL
jgi:hypothetical protein